MRNIFIAIINWLHSIFFPFHFDLFLKLKYQFLTFKVNMVQVKQKVIFKNLVLRKYFQLFNFKVIVVSIKFTFIFLNWKKKKLAAQL